MPLVAHRVVPFLSVLSVRAQQQTALCVFARECSCSFIIDYYPIFLHPCVNQCPRIVSFLRVLRACLSFGRRQALRDELTQLSARSQAFLSPVPFTHSSLSACGHAQGDAEKSSGQSLQARTHLSSLSFRCSLRQSPAPSSEQPISPSLAQSEAAPSPANFPVTKAHRKFVPPIGPKASRISPQK